MQFYQNLAHLNYLFEPQRFRLYVHAVRLPNITPSKTSLPVLQLAHHAQPHAPICITRWNEQNMHTALKKSLQNRQTHKLASHRFQKCILLQVHSVPVSQKTAYRGNKPPNYVEKAQYIYSIFSIFHTAPPRFRHVAALKHAGIIGNTFLVNGCLLPALLSPSNLLSLLFFFC